MKKINRMTAFLVVFTTIFGLCACGSKDAAQISETETPMVTVEESVVQEETTESSKVELEAPCEITVTDAVGREVTVTPGGYNRVVCIGAGALRIYSYIGDVALLCGIEDIDNTALEERPKMFDSVARPYLIANEEAFTALDSCGVGGPNAQAAEAEKILSCNPDIVISEYGDVEKADALQEQLGVPVITLSSGYNGVFDAAFHNSMLLLGTIFGKEERAQTIIDYIDEQVAEISARTADIAKEDKPGVYICGLGNWGTTNHLMTAQNYISFEIANIRNIVNDLDGKGISGGIQSIEEEKFVALGDEMDIIIMDAAAVKNIKPLYQEDNTMFDTCKAWNEGEIYLQMAYNAYYTNFEIALANTWYIAKVVYPQQFEDIDMTEKLNEITRVFLGKELADEIFSYNSCFGGYQKIDTDTFFN